MVEEYWQGETPIAEDIDNYEDAQDLQEAQQEQLDAAFPSSKGESNLYNLFWKVLKRTDSTKVANLNNTEIGNLNISVREANKLGLLGHTFHHPTFGNFWLANAEIINSTSMARQGWFTELFVSNKKFTTRARKTATQVKEGWKLFQKKKTTSQDQEQ